MTTKTRTNGPTSTAETRATVRMMADLRSAPTADPSSEDTGNIVALEHVNVTIPDNRVANLFYIMGMGFTRDPHLLVGPDNMWVNFGENQFHLPLNKAQVLRGRTGIVVTNLDQLEERLQTVAPDLKGTKFGWTRKGPQLQVTCPWGNTLIVHEASQQFGGMRLGMPYVEFDVPLGTARGIAAFYQEVIGAPSRTTREGTAEVAHVSVGRHQELRFCETRKEIPAYDGHHIAIYVANVSHAFNWFQSRGLLMEQLRNHQYRFKQIVDPKTSKPLFELEHEVRSMKHPMYMRTLVNRDPTVNVFGYQRP